MEGINGDFYRNEAPGESTSVNSVTSTIITTFKFKKKINFSL